MKSYKEFMVEALPKSHEPVKVFKMTLERHPIYARTQPSSFKVTKKKVEFWGKDLYSIGKTRSGIPNFFKRHGEWLEGDKARYLIIKEK